jgi:dipeptidase E
MKRVVLFSTLTETNRKTILNQIFPKEITSKVFSYIPSSGVVGAEPYIEEWRTIANEYGAKFNVIDNSVIDTQQQAKLLASNIIVISGGNTFNLLRNLRESGLDKSIKQFAAKPEFVLAGFSAGALVLTPTISVCNLPNFDDNQVGIEDLSGLGIVDFEIFPHYDKQTQVTVLENYRKATSNKVIEIADEDYIRIDQ